MGSEDFSYYLQKIPGAFFGLVIGNLPAAHSPDYDFNDDLIPLAVKVY